MGACGAGDRHRRAGHRRRLPASCCSRRCRWCAGSGRCSSWASAVALVLALTAGTAVLVLARRRRASDGAARALAARRGRAGRRRAPAAARGCCAPGGAARARGAGRGRAAIPGGARGRRASRRRAAGRWTRGSRSCPTCRGSSRRTSRAVRDLDALQRDTGVAGEVDVLVEGARPDRPEGRRLDARLPERGAAAARLLGREGLRGRRSCARRCRCPDLFRTPELSATREQIRALLDAVPPYFSQAAITPDRRDRGARLRAPAAVAGGAARGDAGHARAAGPAPGRARDASPACRCWPPTPTTR